ncbi:MAG: hypothetical protein ABI693_15620 [Bryobacteraceae bacterium]
MATEKQIEANRANAQQSTGPVTEEGKTHSSRNALSHGLTSKDVCVAPGQEEEFASIEAAFREELDPTTPMEFALFNQLVSSNWRLLRADRAEAALVTRVAEPGLDPILDPKFESTLRTIQRVRAQAARDFHKATAELRKVQTENQYRVAAMPEEDGNVTKGLGLADWQTIRTRIKREAALDTSNTARELTNTISAFTIDDVAGLAQNEANSPQASTPDAASLLNRILEQYKTNPNAPAV